LVQVQRNLEKIIETAQARGITVVLCAIEALPLHGRQHTVDFHNLYTDPADKYELSLVPFVDGRVLETPT
jgi:acyl-CoA thioesterase-1